ncbi:MAG: hypothetical protein LBM27_04265 [Lactobacillaceae bacterium]|jgi:competence protein ComGD|nr:hypothetical protein [Lactobacillaceae bacterium]
MYRSNSFTLLETSLVLLVVSLFVVLGFSKTTHPSQLERAVKTFDTFYNQARTNNFLSGYDREIRFENNQLIYRNRHTNLPKGIHIDNSKLTLKSNGYVAPQTIIISDFQNQKTAKLIFSLGFGAYRVEK